MLSGSDAERFFKEARAVAQLAHPSIVPVFEIGKENGVNFIASEFVSGMPLDEWMKVNPLSAKEIATLVSKLCDALHHAHENGIVHRDLKPGNIIMDESDEPHVLDFGLARREVGEVTMTLEGQIFGTPAYMAPEQAKGDGYRADRRADVYALGVILFELLTNEKPFRGKMPTAVLKQVIEDEPPSTRKLNSSVPVDLDTICLKCLEKDASRRFSTAKELAEELDRFAEGHPIKSRPVGRLEKSWRWTKRNPKVAGLLLVVFALLASGWFLVAYAAKERRTKNFVRTESANSFRRTLGKTATAMADGHVEAGDVYLEFRDFENALKKYEAAVQISPPENRDKFKEILDDRKRQIAELTK